MSRSIILAAGAVLAFAGAAHAQQTFKVSTQGLNLSTADGAKVFYGRIRRAAADACGGAPTNYLSTEEERFQSCFRAAVDAGVAQAHAPLVEALNGKGAAAVALASR